VFVKARFSGPRNRYNATLEDQVWEKTILMKKALIVAGGWDGHEPKQCAELFAPLLQEKGFEVEISETLDSYLDTEKMNASTSLCRFGQWARLAANRKKACWTQ
jgi:hypothetical protein